MSPKIAIRAAHFSLLCVVLFASNTVQPEGQHWWNYVRLIASDEMEGRHTGSAGYQRAADYVADQFASSGLSPAGTNGFLQTVPFDVVTVDPERSKAALVRNGNAETLVYGQDILLYSRDKFDRPIEAPLVFVGYGLSAPEAGYDDLAGIDLHGKIAVYLSGAGPSNVAGNVRAHFGSSALRRRALARAGALGQVRLLNPAFMDIPWDRMRENAHAPNMLIAEKDLQDEPPHSISATLNPSSTEKWFAGSDHTFAEILALAQQGKPLPHFALQPSLRAQPVATSSTVESPNVIAVLRGTDPKLSSEYVALSAHLDHLGVSSGPKGRSISNGVMDNASGVAALLEIAHELKDSNQRTKRSLLFLAFTGEEEGLLGSKYFTAHPTVPAQNIVADLNLDMFLPIHPMHVMTVFGMNESSLGPIVQHIAAEHNLKTQDDPYPQRMIFIRSDQYNFVLHGIPSVMCMDGSEKGTHEEDIERTWLSNRYHSPDDNLGQPVDLEAAGEFNTIMKSLLLHIADDPGRPEWNSDSFFRRFAASQ